MEGQNSGGSPPQNMDRASYARKVRSEVEQRHQRMLANRERYRPQLHEQITRLFSEYQTPFYATLRGFNRHKILTLIENKVLTVEAGTETRFTDTEVQAVTEHLLDSLHNVTIWKWAMTGMAAYMTYRGRATWRFPFFKAPSKGKFSPFTGTHSTVGNKPFNKFIWHSARFTAYYAVFLFMGEPIFQGINFMRQTSAMTADPRLRRMVKDNQNAVAGMAGGQTSNDQQQDTESWGQDPQPESNEGYNGYNESQESPMVQQTQSSWTSYRKPAPQAQPSQQSSSWGTTSDIIDDASPTAFTGNDESRSANAYSGSAWDRVRQQSQYQPKRAARPQDQQTWEKPQSTGGWGNDTGANPSNRGSGDDYSFSSADQEKALAKNQAQKDFDRLLDKERSGVDQERGGWSRR